jgi:ABC-2 type transport system ATP-binding protein
MDAVEDSPPISVREISKSFRKVKALTRVSLDVPRHSVYALIGANGTGKSTLMRILLNIHQSTSGTCSVLGTPSTDLQAHHFQRIGYVAEGQRSPDWLTAEQYGRFLQPFYPAWDASRYRDLCRHLRVPMSRPLSALSRGTRMKVLLSGTLAFHPECLLLDEPLGGLDPLAREEVMAVLREPSDPVTILISSHDLYEIESFATHIGFLDEGRLLFSEPIADLRSRFEGLPLREIFLKLARESMKEEAL